MQQKLQPTIKQKHSVKLFSNICVRPKYLENFAFSIEIFVRNASDWSTISFTTYQDVQKQSNILKTYTFRHRVIVLPWDLMGGHIVLGHNQAFVW